MARSKADLPTKTCRACGRPFAWRKKWEQVQYCSDACRKLEKKCMGKDRGSGG